MNGVRDWVSEVAATLGLDKEYYSSVSRQDQIGRLEVTYMAGGGREGGQMSMTIFQGVTRPLKTASLYHACLEAGTKI